MAHPAMHVVLLSLVALLGQAPTHHLLHLLILPWGAAVLHWGVLAIPLGAVVGIVTNLSTLVASVAHKSVGHTRLHRGSCRGHLAVLLEVGVLSLLNWALELLDGVLELMLPKVPTQAPKAEWHPLLWSEARASVAPRLSL